MLRVGDEHAGKKAKCPNCSAINEIPSDPPPTSENPFTSGMPQGHDQAIPTHGPEGYPHYAERGRGGIIFALGLISLLFTCFIPGIFAFVMGRGDLARMREGTMDPNSEGLTQAGMILGLISMILGALSLIVVFGYLIIIFVFFAAAGANGGF
jgi:phage FluMu protein Com